MNHILQLNKAAYETAVRENRVPNPEIKPGLIRRCIAKIKAKRQVTKIMRSLHEAKEIHEGKRRAISLDEFLKDF